MLVYNFDWKVETYLTSLAAYADPDSHILYYRWMHDGAELPNSGYLYAINQTYLGNVRPIYIGIATTDVRERFTQRSDSIRNFASAFNPVPGFQKSIMLAKVSRPGVNFGHQTADTLAWGERWLIRALYRREHDEIFPLPRPLPLDRFVNPPRYLQNILKVEELPISAGTTINHNGNRPAYLDAHYVYNHNENF